MPLPKMFLAGAQFETSRYAFHRTCNLRSFRCPYCGGKLLDGDPKTGIKYRENGKCIDCGKCATLDDLIATGRHVVLRVHFDKPREIYNVVGEQAVQQAIDEITAVFAADEREEIWFQV